MEVSLEAGICMIISDEVCMMCFGYITYKEGFWQRCVLNNVQAVVIRISFEYVGQ